MTQNPQQSASNQDPNRDGALALAAEAARARVSVREDAGNWLKVMAIALLLAGLYALLAGSTTLWDRDEPRYARTSVETWEGGNWLVPHINDQPRLRKPPLIYWVMAPFVGVMGHTTLAARMCSVLAIAGTAVLTYMIGKLMFSSRVGLYAMVIFGTAGMTVHMGAASMIDATMILFTTLAIYVFLLGVYQRVVWWHWLVLSGCFSAIALLKGPLVWPIPLLAMIGTAVLARSEVKLSAKWWGGMSVCAVLGLLSLLAWAIPADMAADGALWEIGFKKHVVQRVTSDLEGHGSASTLEYVAKLPLYVPMLIAVFFPWTLHLPGAIRSMLSGTLGPWRERAILIATIVPWFVLASLASTKLPHYLLPVFPFLAILAAAGLAARERGEMTAKDRAWLCGGVWFFAPMGLIVVGALVALPWVIDRPGFLPMAVISALAAAAWVGVAVAGQMRERIMRTTLLLGIGMPVGIAWATQTVLPAVEVALKVSAEVAQEVRARLGPTDPLYMIDYDEPSLFFYLDRPVGYPVVQLRKSEIADWAFGRGDFAVGNPPTPEDPHGRRESGGGLIIGRGTLEKVESRYGRLPVEVVWSKPVIDYSRGGRRDEVLLVLPVRPGSNASEGER